MDGIQTEKFRKLKVGNVLCSKSDDAVVMLITSQEDTEAKELVFPSLLTG